ncbi:MAG: phosphoribosylformylglycinamidine synthase I [DPANN group archaeon]|nr:phosphoribosylformylglycinamidine synthase I [DPANN group archaeon]
MDAADRTGKNRAADEAGGRREGRKARIAVIYFPGNNCEEETMVAIRTAGMEPSLFRWNEDPETLEKFDGYVLPGGWAYEDRVRAGAIAAKEPIVEQIRKEAAKGKPVLGICNGFQVLAESGMLPGLGTAGKGTAQGTHRASFALAPNRNPFICGYYCTWIRVKVSAGKRNAFNRFLKEGQVIRMPIAHGEGRLVSKDHTLAARLVEKGQVMFRYCDVKGNISEDFPVNPNGAEQNIAAICNSEGNVMGMMPHPERANFMRQLPGMQEGWEEAEAAGPGRPIFGSMREYIEERQGAEGNPGEGP